jgi:putative membrane-bound dehydrogenase-like protein
MIARTPVAFACLTACCLAAEFPAPFDSEKDATAKPAPVAAAAAGFTAIDGLAVDVFAAEPDVANPIAMAWDARGRLWIAENFTYEGRPVRLEQRLRDRVVVFDDRDGDGRPDRRTVFRDDLVQLTSVEVGLGGVWLLCPPQLLFVPDADGDAVPDGPAQVVLDGFDVAGESHHNFANGLRFGPDGWLYGRCGASCPAAVGRPGTPAADRVPVAGGIWRFAPWSGRFEALCHGTTNPWGHDWNAWGDGFFINTVNGHLWQIIPGAHYVRPLTIDPNPHAYEALDVHADHWHFDVSGGWHKSRDGAANDLGGGHAHSGAMICLGDGWPEEYRGDLFTWNFHGRRLNRERLERHGSGYVARHRPDILLAADPFFRGIELAAGPDGAVYALDWSDTGECHEHTGVHRTSGRIFRIAARGPRPAAARPDLAALGAAELAGLATQSDEWHVRQARLRLAALTGRGPTGHAAADLAPAHAVLRRLVAADDPLTACRAVLALHAAGGADGPLLRGLLAHPDEHVRAWGVRLFSDDWPLDGVLGPLPAAAAEADRVAAEWNAVRPEFLRLAASDPSGLVRLALASCLQRLPVAERPTLAAALMARAEDAADHNLPLLVWYGLIPVVEADPARAADLALAARWPKTQRLLVRRLAGLVDRRPEAVGRVVEAIASTDDVAVRRNLLGGLADGLTGWRRAPKPPGLDAVAAAVAGDPVAVPLTRDLAAVFGDGRARDEIRRLVLDAAADEGLRRSALEALVRQGGDLRDECLPLLGDQRFNLLAAEGLATRDDPAVAAALVRAYAGFRAPARPQLVAILSSRRSFAGALLAEVEAGRIPAAALSAYDLRQIRALGDAGLDAAVERVYGGVAAVSADARRRIDDLKAALRPDVLAAADCRRGRALFEKSCGRCHRLFGAGEAIGPDLTGGNRTNLDYLLENIVDPSGAVSRDFRMSIVVLDDGRVVSGLVTARDDRTLTVVTLTDRHTFALEDVDEVKVTAQSPMPEGLLDPLSPEEIRDLIAYLMQPAQVPLP